MSTCLRWIFIAVLTSLVAALSSCGGGTPGGGGGIGGTGVITVADGLSEGTITGFGSILLNGRRFDTDQATVLVNNREASTADLAVGMTVSAQVNFSTNTATRIEYFPTVIGRVESKSGSTVTVLGQTVKTNSNAVSNGINLADISVGTAVEISGSRDKDDAIVATYITAAAPDARTQITGLGSGFGSGNTIQYGGVTVPLDDFGPFPSFTSYDRVQVQGGNIQSVPNGSTFRAENVQVVGGDFGSEGTPIELEGILIENVVFGFSTGFAVAGRPLLLTSTTRYEREGGTVIAANNLTAGNRVEVEGKLSFGGAINVERIIILASAAGKLTGVVEALNPESLTITVLGTDVHTTDRTKFNIRNDTGTKQNYSTLRVGDSVGVSITQDGERLLAAGIETTTSNAQGRIEGLVTSVGHGFVDVAGVRSRIGINTRFSNAGERLKQAGTELLPPLQVGDTVTIRWDNYLFAENPADEVNTPDK